MKKFIVSAGLVAVGAAALQTAMADDSTGPKYWSVGATLRGFYDDNYNIGPNSKGSFGTEVLPFASIHVPLRQTDLGVRYTYGNYYYEDRDELGLTPIDQTHQVDLWIDHAFNERWHTRVTDTFSSGQEPELLSAGAPGGAGAPIATPYRINGDNIVNNGAATLDTTWTRLFSTTLTYNNTYAAYQNSGAKGYDAAHAALAPGGIPGIYTPDSQGVSQNGPSLAGILNRDEESIALDLKWLVLPETSAFVGYKLGWVNYLGNEAVAYFPARDFIYHSADRDQVSHTGYVGVQHAFTPNLSVKVEGGASYVDVYADPLFPSTSWTPYANVSLTYTYLPGCFLQAGFTQSEGASDQLALDPSGHMTDYAENSVIFINLSHKITEKLTGSAIGRIQYSTYNAGAAANQDTTDYGLGLTLNYAFNTHLSAEAAYNYDTVQSDIAGYGYDRNRVSLGLTLSY